jgi:hypothetical protein
MANDYVRIYRGLVRRAARPTRDAAHGGIEAAELIADVSIHAD